MQHYLLPRHVHLCLTDDAAIFLDLRRNQYVGVDKEVRDKLASLVTDTHVDTHSRADEPFVRKLVEAGLLTCDGDLGLRYSPPTLARPIHGIRDAYELSAPRILARHVFTAVRSYLEAVLALRAQPLAKVLGAVARLRLCGREDRCNERDRLLRLARVFLRLQPFIYTAEDGCLLESIALVRFLSRYALFPTLVIGVQTTPFKAHCWVQQDELVLNESAGSVCAFTPILAI